jgi:hypothetical protein
MKKLLAFSYLVLVAGLCFATASPVPLLLQNPWMNFSILGNAVDVALVTAYADEAKRPLFATMMNELDIAKDITVIPNVKNTIALTKLTAGDGFRPYSGTHEPKLGALAFSDRYLTTAIGKRDLLIDVRDFKTKHLAWRTRPGDGASKTINDMDFAPFVWDLVFKAMWREVNDEVAFFGIDRTGIPVYVPANTYVLGNRVTFVLNGVNEWFQATGAVAANQSPLTNPALWRNITARAVVPGIETYLTALIGGGFAVTPTGAVTNAATALAANQALFRSFIPAYKNNGVIIHGSYTDYEFLLDALATRTQYISADTQQMLKMGLLPVPETGGKCFFKPATWLGTSRRLIAEPIVMENGNAYGANLVMGTDLLSDGNSINLIPDVYTLKTGITFDLGFQVSDPSALRLGNQA